MVAPLAMAGALKAGGGLIKGIANLFGSKKGAKLEGEAAAEYLEFLKSQGVPDPNMFVAQYGYPDPDDFETFQPLLESAIQQQTTGLSDIQLDPQLRQAKMQALQKLQQTGEEGMTLEERAASQDILRKAGAAQQSGQEAALASMARRGTLGGGAELQARMAASEAGTEQAARAGEALALERNRRALQSVLESGKMAGNIEQSDYQRMSEAAKAQDVINQFNVGQQSDVQYRNVGGMNKEALRIAEGRERLKGEALGLKNTQADQMVTGNLNKFEAERNKAKSIADATKDEKLRRAGRKREVASRVGSLVDTGSKIAGDLYSEYGPSSEQDGSGGGGGSGSGQGNSGTGAGGFVVRRTPGSF
jgi:hypothetical protein